MFPLCCQTLLHLHLLHLLHNLPLLSLHPLRALPLLLHRLRRRRCHRWWLALVLPARSSAVGVWRSVCWLHISLPLILSSSPLLIESLEPATSSSSCRYHSMHLNQLLLLLLLLLLFLIVVALCVTSSHFMAWHFFLKGNKRMG